MDRPEYVEVGDDDDEGHREADDSRPSRCTQRQGLERHPDGHEPVGADDDDQPGAKVERHQQEEHERPTGGRRRVQPLDAGGQPNPRLECADVQHRRVDHGEHLQSIHVSQLKVKVQYAVYSTGE